ncbi:hypothetical protein [Mahella australiensis]|uniref:Uncharacterized protein n=1 Tax=Mahella australiensis (strain DSM 15567 / CIP 107919 / 50-1 BON) TaxID=697281 RepID=F4A133_MAHA5|nr:hypothetical protein [Mahella australiensis]AEE95936.1 hypothetical protein Mahau_0736 [Mahella australiensis 50-1 BON]
MSSKQKWVIAVVAIFLVVVYLYFNINKANWDIFLYKHGYKQPIMWDSYNEKDEPVHIKIENRQFEKTSVQMTDLYYLPNLKRLHFGIWFDKSIYSSTESNSPKFHIEIVNDKGETFDKNAYVEEIGTFEIFQLREIEGVDLKGCREIKIMLYPVYSVKPGSPMKMGEPEEKVTSLENIE